MRSRPVAAFFMALLAANFLFLSAFAGYGLYLARQVSGMAGSGGIASFDVDGESELVVWLFGVTTILGILAAASSFGYFAGKTWAKVLWAGSTALVLGCIAVSVISFDSPLKAYWIECVLVAASWWYALRRGERVHAG